MRAKLTWLVFGVAALGCRHPERGVETKVVETKVVETKVVETKIDPPSEPSERAESDSSSSDPDPSEPEAELVANASETGEASETPPLPRIKIPPSGPIAAPDEARIRKVIQRNQSAITACTQAALMRSPALAGQAVTVVIAIDRQGEVERAEASGVADAALVACIVTAVERWSFPAPSLGGSVRVTQPFEI